MHEDEKYVVFKREEFAKVIQDLTGMDGVELLKFDSEVADAVVIRTQDVFAVSGLRAYRDTILTHRNLLRSLFEKKDYPPSTIEEMIDNLDRAIEYFTEVTIEAEDRFNRGEVKVPD